jgi:UDP-glucose 4-epimerase
MKNKIVLVTGSAGFIGGYIVEELLIKGFKVIGLDDNSKYKKIKRSYEKHKNFKFIKFDVRNEQKLYKIMRKCDYVIAGAALIGGISYFHTFAYDLLAKNEQIIASTCNAAIKSYKDGRLKKILYLSSSMVFESTKKWPSYEGSELKIPVPSSSYGFQKLSLEFFAKSAFQQYKLPYTIIRPFNCVGIGESKAKSDKSIKSGNIELAMSHVVPDLIQKIIKGQNPLRILGTGKQIRHYTYGQDLAKGVVLALTHPKALNEDFNLSSDHGISVLNLAKIIWIKIHGKKKKFKYILEKPFLHDVQKRVPSTYKAKKILNFKCRTNLDEMLDIVIPWVKEAIKKKII